MNASNQEKNTIKSNKSWFHKADNRFEDDQFNDHNTKKRKFTKATTKFGNSTTSPNQESESALQNDPLSTSMEYEEKCKIRALRCLTFNMVC